ncbi:MAG: MBL fold metallo-hydrolase [Phenylobacterium sp.]|jgi:ribonuclease Z|uniref:MBL fold metallo-hydrolase n=1 Tax=Phenylobacterium sp. TaxID=1871053 RepID=UPI002A36A904|nr:MBL fold metallo-hydrolase [Phenylobacterium sp.]MDX9998410.1 MBL fold metallo-hydrolase [Phenylobacterium sp.]
MSGVLRVLVFLYGGLFALMGLAGWLAPERLAERLGLSTLTSMGLASLRADLGGLFVAMAVMCIAGAVLRRRGLLVGALVLMAAVLAGRLIGVLAQGALAGNGPALVVEAGAVLVLALAVRQAGGEPGRSRRGLLIAGGVLAALLLGIGVIASLPGVQQRAFETAARAQISRDNTALMADDALRVAVCGSSAPLPSPDRAKACVAVIAGGKIYVVDVGPESVERLMQWGVPLSQVSGVLLTHFHSDHIGDLGELNLQTWAQGRPAPLAVYGGPGVEQVVAGFNQAYGLDQGYRTAHHGAQAMPAQTWPMVARPVALPGEATPAKSRTGVVLQDGELTITAIEVEHDPVDPAYAYRFDYKGRSVVITGDTRDHAPLIAASRGADILMSEALARPMIRTLERLSGEAGRPRVSAIMHDIQSYHISPEEAARIANEAQVKLLVLYHLLPAPDNALARRVFVRDLGRARKGEWRLADDGSLYTLPVDSAEVRVARAPR